jgi:hypothetical protein
MRHPHTRKVLGRGRRLDWAYSLGSRNVSLPYLGTSCCRVYWLYLLPESHPSPSVGMSERMIRVPFFVPRNSSSSIQSHSWTDMLLLELPCSNGESCPCCLFQTNQPEIAHIPLSSPDLMPHSFKMKRIERSKCPSLSNRHSSKC